MGGRSFPGFKIEDPAEYERVIEINAEDVPHTVSCPHTVDNTADVKDLKEKLNTQKDEAEQAIRHEGGNVSKLYGMEYWTLAERIESLISVCPCEIYTSNVITRGTLAVKEDGSIYVISD